MNELVYKDTSRVLIEELRVELKSQAESFVKVGYLLKVARDTDILKDTSYANVNDLATAEYGLTPDMVSRYIRIYERFGDGEGNLLTEYQGYGVAKLQIMITLPDEINEQLSPEMTKSQITKVAAEVHEEQKISDMEVMCEDPANKDWTELQQFFMAYFKDHKQQFLMIFDYEKPFPDEKDYTGFKEIFFPAGTEMIFARIPQSGKVMLSAEGVLTYIRSGERIEYTWEDIYKEIAHELQAILHFEYTPEGYADLFGKEPVAPVQEAKSEPKEPKSVSKEAESVSKEAESVSKEAESVSKDEKSEEPEEIKDEDVPGQAIITPDGIEVQAAGKGDETTENPNEAAGEEYGKIPDIIREMQEALYAIEREYNELEISNIRREISKLEEAISRLKNAL